jgi:hypothetical protein
VKKFKLKRPRAKSLLVGAHMDANGELHTPDHAAIVIMRQCEHSIGIMYYGDRAEADYILQTFLPDGLCPPCYAAKHGRGFVAWLCARDVDDVDGMVSYYPAPGICCPDCERGTKHKHSHGGAT